MIEGWHNRLQHRANGSYIGTWKFFNFIKSEQDIVELRMAPPDTITPRARQFVDIDERIKTIVLGYDHDNICGYLKDLANITIL